MSTVTSPRPRSKVNRSVRLLLESTGPGDPHVVSLTVGKETAEYFVWPVPSAWGKAFKVEKLAANAEVYFVNLDGAQSTCECKGFCRWGHCKHRDGLQVLVDKGLLPAGKSPQKCA